MASVLIDLTTYCALPKKFVRDYKNKDTILKEGIKSQKLKFIIEEITKNHADKLFFICNYKLSFFSSEITQAELDKIITDAGDEETLKKSIEENLQKFKDVFKLDTVWDNTYTQNKIEYPCCVRIDTLSNKNTCVLPVLLSKTQDYDIYDDFINTQAFDSYGEEKVDYNIFLNFLERFKIEDNSTISELQATLSSLVDSRSTEITEILDDLNRFENLNPEEKTNNTEQNKIIDKFSALVGKESRNITLEDVQDYIRNKFVQDSNKANAIVEEYKAKLLGAEVVFNNTIEQIKTFHENENKNKELARNKLFTEYTENVKKLGAQTQLYDSSIAALKEENKRNQQTSKDEKKELETTINLLNIEIRTSVSTLSAIQETLKTSSSATGAAQELSELKIVDLEKFIIQLKAENDEASLVLFTQLTNFQSANEELGRQLELLAVENNLNLELNSEYEQKKKELTEKIERLTRELDSLSSAANEKESTDVQTLKTQITALNTSLEELKVEHQKKITSNKQLTLERDSLFAEVEQLKFTLDDKSGKSLEEVNKLEDDLAEAQRLLTEKEKEINTKTKDNKDQNDYLVEQNKTKTAEVEDLEKHLKELSSTGQASSEEAGRIREEIREARQQILEKDGIIKQHEKSITEKENLNRLMKTQLDNAITYKLTMLNNTITSNLKEIVLRRENDETAADLERKEREEEAENRRVEQNDLDSHLRTLQEQYNKKRKEDDQKNDHEKNFVKLSEQQSELEKKRNKLTGALSHHLIQVLAIKIPETGEDNPTIETLLSDISALYLGENGLYYKMSSLEPDYFVRESSKIYEYLNGDKTIWDTYAGFFPFFYQKTYIPNYDPLTLDGTYDTIKNTHIYRNVTSINILISSLKQTIHPFVDRDKVVFFYEYITKMKEAMKSYDDDDGDDGDPNYFIAYIHNILSEIKINFKAISENYQKLTAKSKQTIEKICSYNLNQISKNFLLTYVKFTDKKNGVNFITEKSETITTNPRYKFLLTGEEKDKYNQMDLHYCVQRTEINSKTGYTYVNGTPIKKIEDKFRYGKFTNVFKSTEDNKAIANKMKTEITDQVIGRGPDGTIDPKNKRPVFIIGYGASGSGKTSALVYLRNKAGPGEPGIFLVLCNTIGKDLHNNKKESIEMKINIIETGTNVDSSGKKETYDQREITAIYNNTTSQFELNNYSHSIDTIHSYRFESDKKGTIQNLGDALIDAIDDDRVVKPTPNNPNSSRTHCIAYTTITQGEEKYVLVLGDFAGVENKFDCNNITTIKAFANIKGYKSQEYESLKKENKSSAQDSYSGGGFEEDDFKKIIYAYDSKYDDVKLRRHPNVFDRNDLLDYISTHQKFSGLYRKYSDKINKGLKKINPVNFVESLGDILNDINKGIVHTKDKTVYETYSFDKKYARREMLETFFNVSLNMFLIKKKKVNLNPYHGENTNRMVFTKDERVINGKALSKLFYLDDATYNKALSSQIDLMTKRKCLKFDINGQISGANDDTAVLLKDITEKTYVNTKTKMSNNWVCVFNDWYGQVEIKGAEKNITSSEKDIASYMSDDIKKNEHYGEETLTYKEMIIKYLENKVKIARLGTNKNDPVSNENIDFVLDIIKNNWKEITPNYKNYTLVVKQDILYILKNPEKNDQTDTEESIKEDKTLLTELRTSVMKFGKDTNAAVTAGKFICERRTSDGEYINGSLRDMRKDIDFIMSIKGKSLVSYCPNFVPTCYKEYRGTINDPSELFRMGLPNASIFNSGGLIDTVFQLYTNDFKSTTMEEFSNKIIISLFCVFNVTREIKQTNEDANVIPTVHYTNVSELLDYEINQDKNKIQKFITGIKTCFEGFDDNDKKYNYGLYDVCKFDIGNTQITLSEVIENAEKLTCGSAEEITAAIQEIIQFCNNMNAASYIGTLEYMDKLSRLNTTQMICKPTSELVGSVYNTVTGKIEKPLAANGGEQLLVIAPLGKTTNNPAQSGKQPLSFFDSPQQGPS